MRDVFRQTTRRGGATATRFDLRRMKQVNGSSRPRPQSSRSRTLLVRALCSACLSVLLVTVGALHAQPAAAAPYCQNAYLLPTGDGPVVGTGAGFTQQVQVFGCSVLYPEKGFTARVRVHPYRGFAGSHVQACTVHVELSDSAHGYVGDETADCTARARTGAPYEVWVPGWTISRAASSRAWELSGHVNIRTVVGYYGTDATPSTQTIRF